MGRYINNPVGRFIGMLLSAIAVEFYLFPFQAIWMPMNSKTIFAGMGLVVAIFETARKGYGVLRTDLVLLSGFALLVSIASFASMTINTTTDSTYFSYIVSMWVWLSAGYFTLWIVRHCMGEVSIKLVTYLLMISCLFECFMALGVDLDPSVRQFVDSLTNHGFETKVKRMYGLSASLDTAGVRFSVVMVMMAYVICEIKDRSSAWLIWFLWLAFVVITVVGNMIARTTIVGSMLAIGYMAWKNFPHTSSITRGQMKLLRVVTITLLIAVPLVVYYYNNDAKIHNNLRFAFEGFFSLAEKGEWDVASNKTLKSMVVWPDTLSTWIIGDGYIENPKDDPYYVGEVTRGFYKNTDIGYLRFIFYFGVIGLITFASFIVMSARACMVRLPKCKLMIMFLLVLNFLVWVKVSTDLFFIFALLLSTDIIEEDSGEREYIDEDIIVRT